MDPSNRNLRLAINFDAIPCETIVDAAAIDQFQTFLFSCVDSMKSHRELGRIKLAPGTRILARCANTCENYAQNVIGNKIYSPMSYVCASAFHANILKRQSMTFYIIISQGLQCYYSGQSNGITSMLTTTIGDFSVSFMDLNFKNFLPFVNMQVDIVVPGTTKSNDQKVWSPAVVKAVEPTQDGAMLTVQQLDGKNA